MTRGKGQEPRPKAGRPSFALLPKETPFNLSLRCSQRAAVPARPMVRSRPAAVVSFPARPLIVRRTEVGHYAGGLQSATAQPCSARP